MKLISHVPHVKMRTRRCADNGRLEFEMWEGSTLDEAIQEQFECKAFVGHRHCQRLIKATFNGNYPRSKLCLKVDEAKHIGDHLMLFIRIMTTIFLIIPFTLGAGVGWLVKLDTPDAWPAKGKDGEEEDDDDDGDSDDEWDTDYLDNDGIQEAKERMMGYFWEARALLPHPEGQVLLPLVLIHRLHHHLHDAAHRHALGPVLAHPRRHHARRLHWRVGGDQLGVDGAAPRRRDQAGDEAERAGVHQRRQRRRPADVHDDHGGGGDAPPRLLRLPRAALRAVGQPRPCHGRRLLECVLRQPRSDEAAVLQLPGGARPERQRLARPRRRDVVVGADVRDVPLRSSQKLCADLCARRHPRRTGGCWRCSA